MPPNPGIKPKRNSGKQKRAILSAMIRSQTRAKLEPAAESDSIDRSDGRQRRSVDRIHHLVDAFQEFPDAACCRWLIHSLRAVVELAQIGPGTES